MQPPEFIATMTLMAFGFALVLPMVRAWARRIEAKGKAPALIAAANDPRLERMEQAIDAIAIEVGSPRRSGFKRVSSPSARTIACLVPRIRCAAPRSDAGACPQF
jgi:hypothetical protein